MAAFQAAHAGPIPATRSISLSVHTDYIVSRSFQTQIVYLQSMTSSFSEGQYAMVYTFAYAMKIDR